MLRCYEEFPYFVRAFWHVIEPSTPLIWGWWLDKICTAVQKQQEGDPEYRWLLVMQPPGTAKSRVMSVMKPAWMWLRDPSRRMLYIATAEKVAERDSKYTRDVLRSSGWEVDERNPDILRCGFREVVKTLHEYGKKAAKDDPLYRYPLWDFEKDQDEKGNFANTIKGVRLCAPMGGDVTGLRGDDATVDDPVSFKEIVGLAPQTIATNMRGADDRARYVYTTRVNDRELSTRTMVMQRFDPDDPAGTAIRDGHWKIICVPMEYDPDHPLIEHMRDDPRTQKGDVLVGYSIDPVTGKQRARALQTPVTRAQAIANLGPLQYEAQYNQNPRRASGEFVNRQQVDALERYTERAADIANGADEVMLTADFTFDDTAGSDKTVIQAWARYGTARFYLLDRVGRQMNYPTMKRELVNMKARWPMARRIRVEKAAAGPMIIAELEATIPGLIGVPTGKGSKFQRASVALQPLILGRNLILPHASIAPWVGEVEASWINMRPNGSDDDDVDAATLMAAQWGMGGNIDPMWLPASRRLDLADIPLLDDGEWETVVLSHKYLISAGPNAAEGTPCAYVVIDLHARQEVAAWAGTVDPQEWGATLAKLGHKYNEATIVVNTHAPGTLSALQRLRYPRVWQDAQNTAKHPGWWRGAQGMEQATHALARVVGEGKWAIRSRDGRAQLVGWTGDGMAEPTAATCRVFPYLQAADVMDRIALPKEERQPGDWRTADGGIKMSFLRDRPKVTVAW